MSDTLHALTQALSDDELFAVTPISVLARPVGLGFARLAPTRRPLVEVRWFGPERRGVLGPRIVRLERLAGETARATGLSLRSESTDPRRAYQELLESGNGLVWLGDDLARRIDELRHAALAIGLPLRARAVLDLQDSLAVLESLGRLPLPFGASLAAANSATRHPIEREAFDTPLGRLFAVIAAWFDLVVPACAAGHGHADLRTTLLAHSEMKGADHGNLGL